MNKELLAMLTIGLATGIPLAAENPASTGVFIYFAAAAPPTENPPSEAPLCYKFPVASLEEQLGKLKVKYPRLYDEQIVQNADGSRNLLAKRKDDQGHEVKYFYSSSPEVCNNYQQRRLQLTEKEVADGPDNSVKSSGSPALIQSVLNKVYSGYDRKNQCWLAFDDGQRYCMTLDRTDAITTDSGDRLYVLVTGKAVDDRGESNGTHVTSGLVGAFVIEEHQGRVEIVASDPKLSLGFWGVGPTGWKLIKLGPSDYWGWYNTTSYGAQGFSLEHYSLIAPFGKTVRDLSKISSSYSDEGACENNDCTSIESTLDVDSTKINQKVYPLLVTITGTDKGKKLMPRTWNIPFNTKEWSYLEPKDWPLKNREF